MGVGLLRRGSRAMQNCLRPEVQPQPQKKCVPDLPQGVLQFDGIVEYTDRVLIEAML